MPKPAFAAPQIELACAGEDLALQMTRWLSHLRAERRLSPKTLEAYARDVRQCLMFLSEHWGALVTLQRFAALEASDVRAFMGHQDITTTMIYVHHVPRHDAADRLTALLNETGHATRS